MSASETATRVAIPADLKAIMAGLAGLARDLGDPFRITSDSISDALFAPRAHAFALLAGQGAPPLGAALCSPFLSTSLGHACVYVSDLWVARAARGQALGRRLIAAAAAEGARRWQAQALFLNVYDDNTDALAFYACVGFVAHDREKRQALKGAAFEALAAEGAPA